MNRTSRSSRLVRTAARSPGRSTAGPLVYRTFTPSSRPMIEASVVLPSPGGPYRRTWSAASPLAFAAVSRIERFALTSRCPMYSSRLRGRSELSTTTSASCRSAARMRETSSVIARSLAAAPPYRTDVRRSREAMLAVVTLPALLASGVIAATSIAIWYFGQKFLAALRAPNGALPPLTWMFRRAADPELESFPPASARLRAVLPRRGRIVCPPRGHRARSPDQSRASTRSAALTRSSSEAPTPAIARPWRAASRASGSE